LDVYNTEDEQVEAIKKWLAENGKSAIFGVVLGLSAIFGWRSWQSNEIEQAETASEIYQSSLVAMGEENQQQAIDSANTLINDYGNTGYAVLARLLMAYIETQKSNYSAAEEHLMRALESTDNETLKHEINLRLARVYTENKKFDLALNLLNEGASNNFSSQYNELKGDIYVQQGKNDDAKLAYQQAIAEAESAAFDPGLLNIKLSSVD
jgi:predicted negative regulator of RcsB-dependent stress response